MSEILSGLLGVLVGGLIGHWLALGRDKRREFNEVVDPVRLSLLKAREDLKKGHAWRAFASPDIDRVRIVLKSSKREALDQALTRYWNAYRDAHKPDGMGGQIILKEKTASVLKEIDYIEALLKRK